MSLLCPHCESDQVEVMTPPLVRSRDTEGAEYVIDPPSTFVCMSCRFVGDVEGDLLVMDVAA